MFDETHKPEIEYPCVWEYKIIGLDVSAMKQAVAQMVDSTPYTLDPSHTSTGGKYVSMTLEMSVPDEAFRVGMFEKLRQHPDIRMVL